MRTVKEIAEILKKEDPETKLTVRALRYLMNTGQLPYVKVGTKALVSLEVLEAFLKGELKKPPTVVMGGLRKEEKPRFAEVCEQKREAKKENEL